MSVNMFSQRALQTTMRRFAATRPTTFPFRAITPATIATGQIRSQSSDLKFDSLSKPVSSSEANTILADQRRNRPVSPHLGIYQPQITWYASALNRITGCIVSGGLYAFGFAYLVAPTLGWHLESASMVAAFAAWPVALKVFAKFAIAWPFTFHSFNGIRHLMWDVGAGLTNKQVIVSGWVVVAISTVSALGLTFY